MHISVYGVLRRKVASFPGSPSHKRTLIFDFVPMAKYDRGGRLVRDITCVIVQCQD